MGALGYLVLTAIFALGVLGQIFVAGMAVFVDSGTWALHRTVVHPLEPALLVLFVLALLGRLSRFLKAAPIGSFLLLSLQYATGAMAGTLVAALHPANAVAIFLASAMAVRRAWDVISDDR